MKIQKEIESMDTVPPPDTGNRVAVGKKRAYRDREKSAIGSNAVLPN